jgi:drug/metabolite transporter (DMT)-like permease
MVRRVHVAGGTGTVAGALACEAAFSLLAIPLLATLGPVGVSTYACAAAAFAYLAVVVTAVGFVLWYSGVRRLGVERAGLFAGLVPVAALVTSAAVGAATFTLSRLVGAVAVGAGVTIGIKR